LNPHQSSRLALAALDAIELEFDFARASALPDRPTPAGLPILGPRGRATAPFAAGKLEGGRFIVLLKRLLAPQTPSQTAGQPSGKQQSLRRHRRGLLFWSNIIDADVIQVVEPRLVRWNVVKIRQQFAPECKPGPV